ncbi:6-phospho-beta-glucosidase [Enterococcus mundtii]|uniref:6-phospho-beta-glucosidase n=1 Tax=Enterococcus mundtii TaxID=53346 RepID=A0A2S7RQI0_ENTMU|nr:6-phospho-beta-glucosidase [Enterococcus mundtii]PQF21878.1 6-phospho-beta-glucosidase [Enterococcus mundtii]
MTRKLKVVTIGGGSGYTPELVKGFITRYKEMPIDELWLVDVEEGAEKLAIITTLCQKIIKQSGYPIQLMSTINRKEALKNADFVLTQIRVGQLSSRVKDENIPLKYRFVGQETNGPGELLNAFRTIPVMIDICTEMEALCPDAWLINFANPAGMLAEAVLNHTNWKKMISICNGPLNIEHAIADALGVDRKRIFAEFVGLNHLVFAKRILLDGVEVTASVVDQLVRGEVKIDNPGVSNWNPEFLTGIQAIPMSYLQYYWKTDEVLNAEQYAANNEGSRAVVAQKLEKELFSLYADSAFDDVTEILAQRGGTGYSECACDLILSLHTDKRDVQTVNTRNMKAIDSLELSDVVEVNCLITKGGPIPLTTGKLPDALNGLIQQMKAFEKVACEAAVTGDYQKALVAMTINPLVSSDTKAKEILDEMLIANEEYLPQFDLSHLKMKGSI